MVLGIFVNLRGIGLSECRPGALHPAWKEPLQVEKDQVSQRQLRETDHRNCRAWVLGFLTMTEVIMHPWVAGLGFQGLGMRV